MDVIDEIEQFNVNDLNKPKPRRDDDEEGEDDGGQRQEEGGSSNKPSKMKKIKVNFDPEVVYAVDVFQELTLIQVETMNKYLQDIKLKHAQLSEKLKEMQPNITSIQAYKERVRDDIYRMKLI